MRYAVAMTEAVAEQARQHLLRPDGQEDVCLATYTVSTGQHRTTYLVTALVFPEAGDRRIHGNASFTGSYLLRGAAHAAQHDCGLVMLHSHPVGTGWQRLSSIDHDTELGYAHIAHQYTGSALLGMTLAGIDNAWSARLWVPEETSPRWAEAVRVVGTMLEVSWNDDLRPPPTRTAAQVRTVSAWPASQDSIARLRVLVVGVGSVGLDVAQRLAATGIPDIGVMDYDVVKELNRDRMIGATQSDARRRRRKVDVAYRQMTMAATAQRPRFKRYPMSICTRQGLAHALDYDVIFSCVDRPWPRAVLNTVAYADLIPVIDGGLTLAVFPDGHMRSGSWRAHTLVPDRPCLVCTGQLNPTDIQLDRQGLLDDPNYIEQSGREPAAGAPNVAAYSASVSAALLAQFVSLTAHPGRRGVPSPLRYLLSTHSLQNLTNTTGPFCQYELDTAIGDGRTPLALSEAPPPQDSAIRRRRHPPLAFGLRCGGPDSSSSALFRRANRVLSALLIPMARAFSRGRWTRPHF
ncbi:ThiF family adenylyltransferase [Mycobacterium sp. MUNTM1]